MPGGADDGHEHLITQETVSGIRRAQFAAAVQEALPQVRGALETLMPAYHRALRLDGLAGWTRDERQRAGKLRSAVSNIVNAIEWLAVLDEEMSR